MQQSRNRSRYDAQNIWVRGRSSGFRESVVPTSPVSQPSGTYRSHMARSVTTPDGQRWTVRAVWFRRAAWLGNDAKRIKRWIEDHLDIGDAFNFDDAAALFLWLAVSTVALLVLIPFVLPGVFFILEAVLLIVLGVLGRILVRQPFPVVASADDGRQIEVLISGPLRSHRGVHALAGAIERGEKTLTIDGADPALIAITDGRPRKQPRVRSDLR